jgi:hypothetical protein
VKEVKTVISPATMADMLRGGYVFLQTKECRDCKESEVDLSRSFRFF